jgi:Flp pilus assembly pilin Flp
MHALLSRRYAVKGSHRRGQGFAEYALVLVLISVLAVATTDRIRKWLDGHYDHANKTIQSAVPSAAPPDPDS